MAGRNSGHGWDTDETRISKKQNRKPGIQEERSRGRGDRAGQFSAIQSVKSVLLRRNSSRLAKLFLPRESRELARIKKESSFSAQIRAVVKPPPLALCIRVHLRHSRAEPSVAAEPLWVIGGCFCISA